MIQQNLFGGPSGSPDEENRIRNDRDTERTETEEAESIDDLMLRPLAERMRPRTLEEYAGQKHLLKKGGMLWNMIEKDRVPSMIFWGPPGVGKTTLASIIARTTRSRFVNFSAVTSGIKEIRAVMAEAEAHLKEGRKTILFVDEIHRFNKAQQDAFLPYVEKGSIILIGATTENPSFEVNSALLSRCRTFVLKSLEEQDILDLLKRTMKDPRGLGQMRVDMDEKYLEAIASFAHGDARLALNTLEMAVSCSEDDLDGIHVDEQTLLQVLGKRTLLYDKKGDRHFDMISALHKSMRNSDVDACIYWLARML